jgi:hypothetical protein
MALFLYPDFKNSNKIMSFNLSILSLTASLMLSLVPVAAPLANGRPENQANSQANSQTNSQTNNQTNNQANTPANKHIPIEQLIERNDVLAFYGHPDSRQMGILGRYTKEELDAKLTALAAEYDAANGDRGVIKAFYLIYGTVQPEGRIGIMSDKRLNEYIDYAADHGIIVFIDHQIGRYDPVASFGRMFPWLAHPNVHLGLDPEWRTTKPMEEIGTVTADELNRARQSMDDYMKQNGIEGERLMVVHQFNSKMISQRERVEGSSENVRLIHCADGFGSPALKRASYNHNAHATNMPWKGFKLFYNFGIHGAGYDSPLLTPAEVCALLPRPSLIIYQ